MEKLAIFLCILIIATSASECIGYHSEDLLQSGIVTFSKNQNLNRVHCQNVNINYNVPSRGFDVALSPSNNFFIAGAVDFSLRGGKGFKDNVLEIVLLINNDQSWSIFKVSYLVDSRTDMWLGSYIANTFSLIECSSSSDNAKKSLKAVFPVNNWVNGVGPAKAYAFISGIRTQDTNIQVSIDTVQFNQSQGNLTVSIFYVGSSLQYIHIDYVVFENTPFTIVVNPYPSSNLQLDYSIIGLDTFNTRQQSLYIQIGIISKWMQCIGNCSNNCIIDDDCNRIKGFKNGRKCYLCPQNQYYYNNSCASQCSNNQFWNGFQCVCNNNYIKYQGICVIKPNCSNNQEYNSAWNRCDCKSQWILINGICQPIPTCKKFEIYNISTNKCQCLDGYAFYNGQCTLKPVCLQNQIYASNFNLCVCIDGWIKYKGVCSQKPKCYSGQIYNSQWNRCDCEKGYTYLNNQCVPIAYCEPNQIYISSNNTCVCQNQYVLQAGKCVPKIICTQYQSYQPEWNNCVCIDGYVLLQNNCYPKPNCSSNEVYDSQSNSCVCRTGYSRINGICTIIVTNCGLNQTLVNNSCVCRDGFIRLGPICVSKCGANQLWNSKKCDCIDGHYWKFSVCQPCPPNSQPNSDKSNCTCKTGFSQVNGECKQKQCPYNSRYYNGQCICVDGYYQDQGNCVPTPKCPLNAIWNPTKLICECKIDGQYLINGSCQYCPENSAWNGQRCVCKTNYYSISNNCRTCANNTYYNGSDCVCNQGWYGNRDGCWKCHDTCGTCSGKQANQCTTCVDVSYNLNNDGTCSRSSPCPKGLYQNSGNCKPCSSYCSQCNSPYTCDKCITGFKLQNISYGGQLVASFCTEICGDGKRFQDECDDGNLINGDGCSSLCKIQKGWTCAGGSSTRASTCSYFIPDSSVIIAKGAVALFGKVVHGFRLSYIPNNLTENDCAQCSKLLWVKVINSSIVPGVRVNYIPKSQFQYLVQFDFYGTIAPPVFVFTVQINPQYSKYFSANDMSQIITKTIDPSTLKKYENDGQLSLNDLSSPSINLSQGAKDQIFT